MRLRDETWLVYGGRRTEEQVFPPETKRPRVVSLKDSPESTCGGDDEDDEDEDEEDEEDEDVFSIPKVISDVLSVRFGTTWSEETRKMIVEALPDPCYMTVANDTDKYCLLYCVALGATKANYSILFPSRKRVISLPGLLVPVCLGHYNCEGYNESYERKFLMQFEPGKGFCRTILASSGVNTSDYVDLPKCKRMLKELERKMFGEDGKGYGINLFLLDCDRSQFIFPVFLSKRCLGKKGKPINILHIQKDGNAHFVLITDMKKAFKNTGGRIFYTCSRCGQPFFDSKMLCSHDCDPKDD